MPGGYENAWPVWLLDMAKDMRKPDCCLGYTEAQVRDILGGSEVRWRQFRSYMHGQTVGVCDGRQYNHDAKEYEECCEGVKHGVVYYRGDLMRFLAGLPVID